MSVAFGLILTVYLSVIGVAAGAVQGYFGGWTDLLFQRFIDIWTSMPTLYLLIILAAFITPTFWILLFILVLFSWTSLVGVVRAEFLRARNFEYVRAARALGLTNMQDHVQASSAQCAGLDRHLHAVHPVGFGDDADRARLSGLRACRRDRRRSASCCSRAARICRRRGLAFTGFLVVSIMLSLLVFVGEAVRDALDPRKTFA